MTKTLKDVVEAFVSGAHAVDAPRSLARDVERLGLRGVHSLPPVTSHGRETVTFVHSARSQAICDAMDRRFHRLSGAAVAYLEQRFGALWFFELGYRMHGA